MARKRYNNAGGNLGASISSAGTTLTFAVVPPFATLVSPDYIPLVLEPATGATPSSNFEIVHVTGYTAGALTATVLRGQEGTTAVTHANGAVWGVVPTAIDFGTANPPTRAYRNTPVQSMTAGGTGGAWTKVQLQAISFDAGNYFDETTNFRYVAATAGNYHVEFRAAWSGTIGSDHMAAVYKNGAAVAYGSEGTLWASSGSDIVQLAVSDYLELWVWTPGGTSGLTINPGSQQTYMTINPLLN